MFAQADTPVAPENGQTQASPEQTPNVEITEFPVGSVPAEPQRAPDQKLAQEVEQQSASAESEAPKTPEKPPTHRIPRWKKRLEEKQQTPTMADVNLAGNQVPTLTQMEQTKATEEALDKLTQTRQVPN